MAAAVGAVPELERREGVEQVRDGRPEAGSSPAALGVVELVAGRPGAVSILRGGSGESMWLIWTVVSGVDGPAGVAARRSRRASR